MHEKLEWWPDSGQGPLWLGGTAVDVFALVIPVDLARRIAEWNQEYAESKLPIDGPGDAEWLQTGSALLGELRHELDGMRTVVVTEPWWGEAPVD